MGLLDTHADSIERGAMRDLASPPVLPPEGFNAWAFAKAGLQGPVAGALDSFGSMRDFARLVDLRQQEEENRRATALGIKPRDTFVMPSGDAQRKMADSFMPDPQTAHWSTQAVAGLTRFAAKAVVDVGTMGPVAGAGVLGMDEANNTAQRLMAKGVDVGTATKVGAVQGAFSAVGAVLPIAGQTLAKTAGLVVAGGPLSFMAQEGLSKSILQKADYGAEAALHDPFDTVGLAVSTLVPAGFGAMGLRAAARRSTQAATPSLHDVVQSIESNGQRYGKDGALLTSPKGAQGEMQVMPGTSKDPGFGVKPAANNSPDELARVGRDYLDAMSSRYDGEADKAMAAYNAGPGAVDAAIKAHGDAWLAHLPKETQDYVRKGSTKLGEHVAARAAADPAAVDSARVALLDETVSKSLPQEPEAHAEMVRAMDAVGAGERVDAPEFAPRPWLKGEDLVGKSYEELDAMHSASVEHNKAVDLEGINRFFGSKQAEEAAGWNKRKRERWLEKNVTNEADDWLQARYINEEMIAEHRAAVNNFDTENAAALGRSIAVSARKVDEPGFFGTPEGHTFANALRYAKEQGWNLDDVMTGMRGRSAEWAGRDAPELFRRLFQETTQPRAMGAAEAPPQIKGPPRVAPVERGSNSLPEADAPSIKPEAAPRETAAKSPESAIGEPPAKGAPRDLQAETIALRKQRSVLNSLLECLHG